MTDFDNKNNNLKDKMGRRFEKLRVSLIDTCNLACKYCVTSPKDHLARKFSPLTLAESAEVSGRENISTDELKSIMVRLINLLQIRTIRFTGGEPLLNPALRDFIRQTACLGIEDIGLTTNGVLLQRLSAPLKEDGLKKINVSLDSLDVDQFHRITGKRHLRLVIKGIEKAVECGFDVKINAVIMRGVNDDQILPLIEFAWRLGIKVRFLELMKMGDFYRTDSPYFFSESEILDKISKVYSLSPVIRTTSATARYWRVDGGGIFGVIANESTPFCHDCNRLRLDSTGRVYGCITDPEGVSVVNVESKTELQKILSMALLKKQSRFMGSPKSMLSLGG